MKKKVILSEKFKLQARDYLRGALISAATAAGVVLQNSIDAGRIEFQWKEMAMAGVSAGVVYLFKNLFLEPTKIITITPTSQAERVTQDIKEIL